MAIHGDDFAGEGEGHQLDSLDDILKNSIELKRIGRMGAGVGHAGHVLKRRTTWSLEGFTWDPPLTVRLLDML